MNKDKGLIDYLTNWEQIPFTHRVASILLVPTILILAIASLPLLVILCGLQHLLTGKEPTIYKRFTDYVIGDF